MMLSILKTAQVWKSNDWAILVCSVSSSEGAGHGGGCYVLRVGGMFMWMWYGSVLIMVGGEAVSWRWVKLG